MLLIPVVAFLLLLWPLLLLRLRVHLGLFRAQKRTIAFLHPFCNDGGGGERVLWVAIRELLARPTDANSWDVVVYTGDAASDDEIRAHALARFGVKVPESVTFVRLRLRWLIEPKRYPVATLLFQAAGSVVLAAEAIVRRPAHLLVDTTGLHFCLPLLALAGVPKLACYVHYPIISSDMLGAVAASKAAHNNAGLFASFAPARMLKLAYYHTLVRAYRLAGRRAHATMANGSWTADHLRKLWGVEPSLVFPPCDTRHLQEAPFRPEKDHALQLRAFGQLMAQWEAAGSPRPRPLLVLAGAVRHADDQARLDALRALAISLGLCSRGGGDGADGGGAADAAQQLAAGDSVLFAPNLPYAMLSTLYSHAAVGLHTMWNEHFGIGVVEMLAAGVGTIAHNSGGPSLDIIDEGVTGRLATSESEYAGAMADLLLEPGHEKRRAAMAAAGRAAVEGRFSEDAFAAAWDVALRGVM